MQNKLIGVLGLGLLACVSVACGDDEKPAGIGGTGAGTSGGSAGQAGAGATAGASGAAGTAGAAGAAGSGGTAGSGGSEPSIPVARSTVPHDANPDVSSAEYASFVSNTNAFGLELFGALAKDGNVIYSPTSTAVALAMTYGGAKGDTATQMAAALHNDLPDDKFHAAVNQLAMDLASRNIAQHETQDGPKSLRLSLINGAFAQKNYAFEDAYLGQLSANYDAGIYLMDFITAPESSRTTINDWVDFHTEDRIQDLVPQGTIDNSTRLVLTNALYFYGSWNTPFSVENTTQATFHTLANADVTVATMHQTIFTSYGEGDGYQLVNMPYDGNQTWMTVLVPQAGRFNEIRGAMDGPWLETALSGMSSNTEVSIAMPKFKFTWGTESFKEPLKAMGMTDAFVFPTADFSGMEPTRELYIGDVLHQAFVGVDEHGTEAAAATAVLLSAGAVPDPKIVTLDRPFVFFIQDNTGALLFAGQVTDPTK